MTKPGHRRDEDSGEVEELLRRAYDGTNPARKKDWETLIKRIYSLHYAYFARFASGRLLRYKKRWGVDEAPEDVAQRFFSEKIIEEDALKRYEGRHDARVRTFLTGVFKNWFYDTYAPSWYTINFVRSEFKDRESISKLCGLIEKDGFGLSNPFPKNTLGWLNGLLCGIGLVSEVDRRYKSFGFSEDVQTLRKKVLQLQHSDYSALSNQQKGMVKKLNRRMLEELYPDLCPRWQPLQRVEPEEEGTSAQPGGPVSPSHLNEEEETGFDRELLLRARAVLAEFHPKEYKILVDREQNSDKELMESMGYSPEEILGGMTRYSLSKQSDVSHIVDNNNHQTLTREEAVQRTLWVIRQRGCRAKKRLRVIYDRLKRMEFPSPT